MMHWQWPAVHAPRGLSTADFYADWAQANFGNEDSYDLAAGKKKDRACRREFKMRLVVGTK